LTITASEQINVPTFVHVEDLERLRQLGSAAGTGASFLWWLWQFYDLPTPRAWVWPFAPASLGSARVFRNCFKAQQKRYRGHAATARCHRL